MAECDGGRGQKTQPTRKIIKFSFFINAQHFISEKEIKTFTIIKAPGERS